MSRHHRTSRSVSLTGPRSVKGRAMRSFAIWVVHGLHGAETPHFQQNSMWWENLGDSSSANVDVFNWSSGLDRSSEISRDDLVRRSRRLLAEMARDLQGRNDERLVALVGYDIGGIVIKQAMRMALQDETSGVASHVSLLIFLGTPHRDRTQSWWRGTISDLFASTGIQVDSRRAAETLMDISQALELIPGIFGACNGFHGRHSVSPYAATLGLPATLERNFDWPADMSSHAANELRVRLGQEISGSSVVDREYLLVIRRFLSFIHEENIVWRPPEQMDSFESFTRGQSFTTWRNTHDGVLSLHGPSRTRLAEASYYLARHLQDIEGTVVVKFTLRCSGSRKTSAAEMLAALVYQILCLRPMRFAGGVVEQLMVPNMSANHLLIVLGTLLVTYDDGGEDIVMVMDGVDRPWQANNKHPLDVLREVRDFCPFKVITTSLARLGISHGGIATMDIFIVDSRDASATATAAESPTGPGPSTRRGGNATERGRERGRGRQPQQQQSGRQEESLESTAAQRGSTGGEGSSTSTTLHSACESGDILTVRRLIDNEGADIHAADEHGFTPLHVASKHGHSVVVGELLRRGVDVLIRDDQGLSPLHLVCQNESIATISLTVVTQLLACMREWLPTDPQSRTPLHTAILSGSAELFRVILDHYLDIWGASKPKASLLALEELLLRKDGKGHNLLHLAARTGNADIMEEILARVASRDSMGGSTRPPLEQRLLRSRDLNGENPIHLAARHGHTTAVTLLCQKGLAVDLISAKSYAGRTALHLACSHGHTRIVTELVEFGADLNVADNSGSTPASEAAKRGFRAEVRFLFNEGASLLPAGNGPSPLYEAVMAGNEALVDELLSMWETSGHADLRGMLDHKRRYPAMWAAGIGHRRLFERLLDDDDDDDDGGGDDSQLTIHDADGNSALHHAASGGNPEIISTLLRRRPWLASHINTPNTSGHTPLQLAAQAGALPAVHTLLHRGAAPAAGPAIAFSATEAIAQHLLHLLLRESESESTHGHPTSHAHAHVNPADLTAALLAAAQKGHLATLRTLLSLPAAIRPSPNCVDSTARTPLILAARADKVQIVRYLTTAVEGVDLNWRDGAGRTALSYAAEGGRIEVVELLAGYGETDLGDETNLGDEAASVGSPLVLAAGRGHLAVVRALETAWMARRDQDPRTGFGGGVGAMLGRALRAAAEGGFVEVVGFLLRGDGAGAGAGLNERYPGMEAAVGSGSGGGSEPERFNALEHALRKGRVDVIRLLSQRLPEIPEPPRVPYLHLACPHPEGLRELLRHCPNVEAADGNRVTALAFAIRNGYLESAMWLLEAGADPKAVDGNGETPLHYAAVAHMRRQDTGGPGEQRSVLNGEFLELLLRYIRPGISIDPQDYAGHTPLLDAVRAGASYSVRMILARDGSSIRWPASEGRNSPLWAALETGRFEMAEVMLELADLRFLTGSHHDLVVLAASRCPDMQVALLRSLPGIDVGLSWVLDLAKNDTTGMIVKHLLEQGAADEGRIDAHGWSLRDFVYATDTRQSRNKSDAEISRTANQTCLGPTRWLSVCESSNGHLDISGGAGTVVRYVVPSFTTPATHGAVRADHPIPPHRAHYFEIRITHTGFSPDTIAIGLCTADTTLPDLVPGPRLPRQRQNLWYLYHGSGLLERSGQAVGDAEGFTTGDIIGCHVDLARGWAYFRKNGARIGLRGRANELLDVAGRLFPVLITASGGCRLVTAFDEGGLPTGGYYHREEPREESVWGD